MPKSVVTERRHRYHNGEDQVGKGPGGAAGIAIAPVPAPVPAPVRPTLRLVRRHRLSKARGVVLGVLSGLVIWLLAALLLYETF